MCSSAKSPDLGHPSRLGQDPHASPKTSLEGGRKRKGDLERTGSLSSF